MSDCILGKYLRMCLCSIPVPYTRPIIPTAQPCGLSSHMTHTIQKTSDWLLPGLNRWCFHFELLAAEQEKKSLESQAVFFHITDTSCGSDEDDVWNNSPSQIRSPSSERDSEPKQG